MDYEWGHQRSRNLVTRGGHLICSSLLESLPWPWGYKNFENPHTYDARHEKTDLKVFVVVIPTHRLLENVIYEVKRLKF